MSHTQAASNLDYRVGDQPVPGYKIIRELGRGAMGVVWLAQTDSGFDRALKVINLRQRGGKKEYRGLRTIKQRKLLHGNLLTLIDYWLKDGEGQFIPDTDDFENTDSFFAPVNEVAGPLSLTQTTPQSISATNADPRPTWQSVPLTARGITMVPQVTPDDASPSPRPETADASKVTGQAKSPERRPAQLIVAMEVGHKTLDDRQKQCQQDKLYGIPVDELLPYMEQAARGLDYLHREGIIHRDIKPHNIMLVGDVAKVCDYGLVVTTDADLRKTSNAFTPLYASPEAVGEQPLTGRTDQYSLAITYVELRTGKSPYSSETAASVYAAKETGKYNLSRIHKSCVRNCLRRALARNPNDRFATCSEFVRELEKAENSHPLVFWTAMSAAAMALIALAVAVAVPGVRERLVSALAVAIRPDAGTNTQNSPNTLVEDQESEQRPVRNETPNTLLQPAAELRDIVADARQLRLAGKFDEALTKLDEVKIDASATDLRHWNYHLERLTTELTSHISSPASVSNDQWSAWQQRAAQLGDQSTGDGADAVLLAAIRLFADTRVDPNRVMLDSSAAAFSLPFAGASQWNKIFREDDQAALKFLRDALGQRLLGHHQPLTTEWKENLNSIWSDREALQIVINRVRHQLEDKNEEGLQATAADLDELSGQFVLHAVDLEPQLAAVRSELHQHRQKTASAQLQPLLREDLASAAARSKLTNLLNSLGDAANGPLARLLRSEAELEASGRPSIDQRNKIRSVLLDLDRSSSSGDRSLADFARFLRTRIDMQLYPNRTPEDVKVLLSWPSGEAEWQTAARSAQAAGILLRLADTSLPSEREGELAIFSASSDQIAAGKTYLEKVVAITGRTPVADGLQAIVAAVSAYQTNDAARWKDVSGLAASALANSTTAKDSPLVSRRPAILFAAAFAAARLKDNTATPANAAALAAFVDLINRHFQESAAANADDELLYNMVVAPALDLPIDESSANVREQLAVIWIAKARLLERDDSYGLIGPPAAGDSKDSYARTILAANAAYQKARQLSESEIAAAGFARTLLKFSRSDFVANRKHNSAEMAALVQRYDPQGNSENASLRMASAWVSWDTALQENARPQQLAGVAASLRHYRFVIGATTERDPYALNSLALVSASNAHVRAAYWTPVGSRDLAVAKEAAAALEKDPVDMSKHDHLLCAVARAQGAQLDDKRRLPEEAFMSEGHALEDLAYYCKFTDNYSAACKAFETAVQNTGLRSKVYALLSLGRCQFRWSREPANISMTRGERVAKIREAYVSLKAALDAGVADDSRDLAEADWWLGQVLEETVASGPGALTSSDKNPFEAEPRSSLLNAVARKDRLTPTAEAELTARLRNFEQAWKLVKQAANRAATVAPQDEVMYRIDSMEIGITLAGYLKQLGSYLPTMHRDELLVEIRKAATQFLELSQRDPIAAPRQLAIRALDVLAEANDGVVALPEGKNNALVVLKKWEPLFSDVEDLDKLVDVLVRQATTGEGEGALGRAESIAKQLTLDSARERALGRIYRTRAELAVIAAEKAVAAASAAKSAGRPAKLGDLKLAELVETFAEAERHLARAKGDDVVTNLNRLCQQPSSALPARFEREFSSNLELHRLREFILETSRMRLDAIDASKGLLNYAGFTGELNKPGVRLPDGARPIAQRLHDLLKARALLRDSGLSPDDKFLLETLERKLGL